MFNELIRGINSAVVKSSVGLISSHRDKTTIMDVKEEDYSVPIDEFEMAIKDLPQLKADDDIVEHISRHAPESIATMYYKWASDLLDKARQLDEYGAEIKDVQTALKYLKKTLEIDPNHSAANLMVKLGKQMLAEGWQSFDEFGFQSKDIKGLG